MWGYLNDLTRAAAQDEDDSSSGGRRSLPAEMLLYNDVTSSQLLEPELTAHAVQVGVVIAYQDAFVGYLGAGLVVII